MYPAATTGKFVSANGRSDVWGGKGEGYARKQKFSPGQRAYPEVTYRRCQSATSLPTIHDSASRQTARGGCRVPGTNVARRAPKRARADEKPDERKVVIREPNPSRGQGQRLTVLVHTTMCPSRQRSSTSSSTIYTTNRQHSKPVASSPNRGFIGREPTSSPASSSTPDIPIELWKKTFPDPSNSPAHHTRSLTIRGIRPSPPQMRMRVVGSAHSTTSYTCTWSPLTGGACFPRPVPRIIAHPQVTPSDCTSPDVLDLICSFPLLEDLALFLPARGMTYGTFLRPHPNSPDPST
jgi:hypothetical protein